MKVIFKKITRSRNSKRTASDTLKYVLAPAKADRVLCSSSLKPYLGKDDLRKVGKFLEAPSKNSCKRKGQNYCHVTVSTRVGEDPASFAERFTRYVKDLDTELGGMEYVAVVHTDTDHPHAHIVLDNYDRLRSLDSKQGARRSFSSNDLISPSLTKLRSMDYTDHFESSPKKEKKVVKKIIKSAPTPEKLIITRLLELLRPVEEEKDLAKKKEIVKNLPAKIGDWTKVIRRGSPVSYKKEGVNQRIRLKDLDLDFLEPIQKMIRDELAKPRKRSKRSKRDTPADL